MQIGVQIAAFSVLVCIIISFFRHKRLNLMSTRFFITLLFISLITIVYELLGIESLINKDSYNVLARALFYRGFLIGLALQFLTVFLYVSSKVNNERRMSNRRVTLITIPFIITILVVALFDIEYNFTEYYATGVPIYALYSSALFHIVISVFDLKKNKSALTGEEKFALLLGLLTYISFTILEGFLPHVNLTSISSVCMVLFIYIFIENPRDFKSHDVTNSLNDNAFYRYSAELLASKKTFYVLEITFKNFYTHQETILHYTKFVNTLKGFKVFYTLDNTFCIICKTKEELHSLKLCDIEKVLNYRYFLIECPKYCKTPDDLLSLVECLKDHQADIGQTIVDESVINTKKYLDSVLQIVKRAIETDGFYMMYQPIYSTTDKSFTSLEALVRLKDEETLGYISPDVFITLAEKNGLINDLSAIVFENVCKFIKENSLEKYGIKYVEVNISALDGSDPQFVSKYMNIMNKYKINPEFINLEITETATLFDSRQMNINIETMKNHGSRFSLDDFGTGYSSIRKMVEMKFDLVKLDKSLLWPAFGFNCAHDLEAKSVLRETITMIKNISSSIVAEGVETKEMLDYLIENGVEHIQGYYYSKPLMGDDFMTFIKAHNNF